VRRGPLNLKLQLICGNGTAMGPGKADLLDAIAEHGSISAAGRATGMSYRRCWLLVDEMNRCFHEPLVRALPGGGRERGARLTEAGRAMLDAYRRLEADAAATAEGEAFQRLTAMLRDEPAAPRPISGTA